MKLKKNRILIILTVLSGLFVVAWGLHFYYWNYLTPATTFLSTSDPEISSLQSSCNQFEATNVRDFELKRIACSSEAFRQRKKIFKKYYDFKSFEKIYQSCLNDELNMKNCEFRIRAAYKEEVDPFF